MNYRFDENTNRVFLEGSITEHDDIVPLSEKLPAEAVLDVSGITRINSSGVRQWIHFVKSVPETVQISLEGCPLVVINQINMIANFLGASRIKVKSLVVPFACVTCGNSAEELREAERLAKEGIVGSPSCPECGSEMEPDVLQSEYLAFLNR